MSYTQAVVLAVVQGLTEFLPISSSGHLVIFQKLFGLEPPVLFDILVHVGTLGAIIFYFKKQLAQILGELKKGKRQAQNLLGLVVLGTIPAAIVGVFLQNYIVQIFSSLRLVGLTLLVTAVLLFLSRQFKQLNRSLGKLTWQDALIVGAFQALAILPGISRSGATIVSGLWKKLDREAAFQFSFFLAIPAIIGALVLQLPGLIYSPCGYLSQGLLGMVVAGIIGFFALIVLERVLKSAKLFYFGLYCLVLGFLVFLI